MYTPRSRLRITAYHIVVASPDPWMRSQGRGGASSPTSTPASQELALGRDVTRGRVDEEESHGRRG